MFVNIKNVRERMFANIRNTYHTPNPRLLVPSPKAEDYKSYDEVG